MIVLVVGVSEDSGKTLLAASLLAALRSLGVRAAPFKPYAATRVWAHPDVLREIEARRLVVSWDSLVLARASGYSGLERVNPVAVLVGVLDESRWGWRPPMPPEGLPHLGVLGRVSMCRSSRVDTLHFINVDALDRMPRGVQEAVTDAAAALSPPPLRVDDSFVERLITGGMVSAVESCLVRLASESEVVVVESNSDVPVPTPSALAADLVLVAAPGVVGIVSGERFRKSVEALGGAGRSLLSVRDVVRLSGVQEALHLPFLDDPESLYPSSSLERVVDAVLAAREEKAYDRRGRTHN